MNTTHALYTACANACDDWDFSALKPAAYYKRRLPKALHGAFDWFYAQLTEHGGTVAHESLLAHAAAEDSLE